MVLEAVSLHFRCEGDVILLTEGLVDDGGECLQVCERKLLFTREVGAVVWLGLGPERGGVDGAVSSFGGQDFRASWLHVILDVGGDLFSTVVVGDEEVGAGSRISAVKDPTRSWVDSRLLPFRRRGLLSFLLSDVNYFDVAAEF
jgi:hypothetical protein